MPGECGITASRSLKQSTKSMTVDDNKITLYQSMPNINWLIHVSINPQSMDRKSSFQSMIIFMEIDSQSMKKLFPTFLGLFTDRKPVFTHLASCKNPLSLKAIDDTTKIQHFLWILLFEITLPVISVLWNPLFELNLFIYSRFIQLENPVQFSIGLFKWGPQRAILMRLTNF